MEALKENLIKADFLVLIDYSDKGGEIILMVDASLEGWGAILL
jgi:hypothetical protein